MKHVKVVARKQLPVRLPIIGTLAWLLALDRIHAPGWAWGVAGTILIVGWIFAVVALWIGDETELKELRGEQR